MRRMILLALLGALAAAEDAPPPDGDRLQADHLPTPYTAEQIRRGCPDGREIVFRLDQGGVRTYQRWRFDEGNAEGVVVLASVRPEDGEFPEPKGGRSKWTELQRHASFPAAATTMSEGRVTVGCGTFDCWIYTMSKGPFERVFHFAKTMPGPPVLMTTKNGGQLVVKMEMIAHKACDYAAAFGAQPASVAPAADRTVEARLVAAGALALEGRVLTKDGAVATHFTPDPKRPYVHATATGIGRCLVRVTAGPLKGAVFAADATVPAAYALPEGLPAPPGPLPVEVVKVSE